MLRCGQLLYLALVQKRTVPKTTLARAGSTKMPKDFHQIDWDERRCRRVPAPGSRCVLEDLDRGQDWTTVSLVARETESRAAIMVRQAGVIGRFAGGESRAGGNGSTAAV